MLFSTNPNAYHSSQANQINSRLLRLPREIRDVIYAFALGGNHIHSRVQWESIEQNPRPTPPGAVSPASTRYNQNPYRRIVVHSAAAAELLSDNLTRRCPYSHKISLALLFTCRQVYSETLLLPYSLNIFSFGSEPSYDAFMTSLRLPQRQAICKLELNWTISKMGLKDLKSLKEVWITENQWRIDRPIANPNGVGIYWSREQNADKLREFWESKGINVVTYS